MKTMTAKEIICEMESLRNEEQRQVLMRFFKTGPGEYGEGDDFLGLKAPQISICGAFSFKMSVDDVLLFGCDIFYLVNNLLILALCFRVYTESCNGSDDTSATTTP